MTVDEFTCRLPIPHARGDQQIVVDPLAIDAQRVGGNGDRLGGHIVQGHIDGVGEVAIVTEDGFARLVEIIVPDGLLKYVVVKGSIAVDGVSLTVSELNERSFTVSLIPETLERTTLGAAGPGTKVNLEVDVLAKYVERLVNR